MNGLNYMLLGIAIMILGHGIIYIVPVPIVFDLIGFCIVLYGFRKSKEKQISYDEKIIACVKNI